MTLWSGRFSASPLTVDDSDRRLLGDDIAGSLAHVAMLGAAGILTATEVEELTTGLEEIEVEASAGDFAFRDGDEDVHTAVERRLGELVGPVAGKLHTGRSRNDQVALDLRLYLRRRGPLQASQLKQLGAALVAQAEQAGDTLVASYTHMQQAQAVPLAHHLLAYAWMLLRDVERLEESMTRIDVSPLGAAAGGGSSLPLDPADSAQRLGFASVFRNSMDAVSSRDFVAEYVFACSQAMVHLSRLAEEIVLWSTSEFGWVTFSDDFMTGSSAMPHKRNPDAAELVRGKTAAVIGDLTTLLSLQKGLPLTYNRDLQEDKRAVFHADDTLELAAAALTGMIAAATFHPPRPVADVGALDLAEVLVGRGVPFREAHETVGRLVARLAVQGRTLADAGDEDLSAASPLFEPGDIARADPAASVRHRISPGGASPPSVQRQLEELRQLLA